MLKRFHGAATVELTFGGGSLEVLEAHRLTVVDQVRQLARHLDTLQRTAAAAVLPVAPTIRLGLVVVADVAVLVLVHDVTVHFQLLTLSSSMYMTLYCTCIGTSKVNHTRAHKLSNTLAIVQERSMCPWPDIADQCAPLSGSCSRRRD